MSLYDDATLILTPNEVSAGSIQSLKPVDGSGDLTVSRNSYANRINSSGLLEYMSNNIARLDYSNGGCPSILVEPQRTNLSVYSEKLIIGFAFSYTGGVFTVDENTTDTLDPFGNNNADKFTTTSNFNDSYTTSAGSGSLTLSIFAKKGTNDTIQLYHQNVNTGNLFATTFNLNTGTIVGSAGTVTPKIEQFANGWYRCSISGADTLAIGNIFRVSTYTGTSYLFGWQLESGSYATSYIPTTSSIVTRVVDSIYKSDIYNLVGVNQGTLFAEYKASNEGVVAKTISLYNTNSPNQIVYLNISQTAGRIQGTLWNGSTSYTSFINSVIQTDMNKIALIWGGGTMQLFVNNIAGNIVSTTGTFDGFNRIGLNYFNGLFPSTGFINSLMVFNRPLTTSEIAQL